MRCSSRTLIVTSLAVVVAALSACGTIPTREERMKSPQTAMRGAAYKRLVITFNEAHQLAVKASDHAALLEVQGGDQEQIDAARQLADDAAKFADDCEWFLANRRRMQWHGQHMNDLWVRYDELADNHRGTILAYTDKKVRKPTMRIHLRNDIRDNDPLGERKYTYESDFSDLFYPVGAKQYPGNPWVQERER